MSKRRWPWCVAMMVLCSASQAYERFGPYVGGGVGQWEGVVPLFDLEDEERVIDFEGDDVSFKVFGGYRFTPWFALEGSFAQYGTLKDAHAGQDLRIKVGGFGAYAVFTLPIQRFELVGRAGFLLSDQKITYGVPEGEFRFTESSSSFVYGGGVGVMLFRNINVRVEYEVLDLEFFDDSSNVWLTVAWRFL